MPSLRHKRGTRALIDAAATANGLRVGEVYLITDEARLTVGTATNAHQALAKQGEGGGGTTNPLDLSVTNAAPPTTGVVRLFRRSVAARDMVATLNASGTESVLQPSIGRKKIMRYTPAGNSNGAPGVDGYLAPTFTGTATARTITNSNALTLMSRLGFVSVATAAAFSAFRVAANMIAIGFLDGSLKVGGFHKILRFVISDPATVAGARMFMGVRVDQAITNVEPSTLTQCYGVGHGAADTNLKLYYGGSAAQTPIDLGAGFPITAANTAGYELALFNAPGSVAVGYSVTNLRTGAVAEGTFPNATPGTTGIAAGTLISYMHGWRCNNATALAVGLDICSDYIETDQ